MPDPSPAEVVSLDALLDAAGRGERILTANRRLERQLLQAHEQRMRAAGETVWETPAIQPWDDWLTAVWDAAQFAGRLPARLLLSPEQEQHLWEQVVADSPAGEALLRPAPTARLAAEAHALLQDWCLQLPGDDDRLNDDVRAFRDWAREFDARCRSHEWLPASRLASVLGECPSAFEGWCDQPCHLLGFEELTPSHRRVLSAFTQAGGRWRRVALAGLAGQAARVSLEDASQEARVVARWVRQRLEANPDARIGVVVPDLAARRAALCRALDAILVPQARRVDTDPRQRPYNVTLGLPLAQEPLVRAALQLLALASGRQPFEAVMQLLRSPHLAGWESERGQRALLDRQLRETGEPHITLARLRHFAAREDRPWHCPVLAEGLAEMERQRREWPSRATPGEWVTHFSRLLKAVGWSRGRPLSSPEYQASEAWRRTLATFATLETVGRPMRAGEAISRLRSLAAARLFQPQTPPTPVQVMGLWEAVGARFDHLWVMGMSDDAWPPSPRPNPFLPLWLQRQHDLPHASEARELAVAQRLTTQLREAAPEVVFSHGRHEEERERRPSPLIADLPEVAPASLELWNGPDWHERIAAAGTVEWVEDTPPPKLAPGSVRGGSSLFRLQSACPFRAFAELRLAARALGEVGIGLDPMNRGSLVHRVLQLVWEALGDRAALRQLSEDARRETVQVAVEQAVEEMAGRLPQIFTAAFRRIESERLTGLVLDWLAIESERDDFTVEANELPVSADIEGLDVALRIDRLDRLPDGRRIVIDYKTGAVSPSAWFGERPDDPQLPLYATLLREELAGVVFAQLRPGEMGFQGVVAEADLVPDARPPEKLSRYLEDGTWPALLAHWSQTVQRLARAFRDSDTRVDPKRYPDTCRYCELTALCRVTDVDGRVFLLDEETASDAS